MRVGKQIHEYLADPVAARRSTGGRSGSIAWVSACSRGFGLASHRPYRVGDQRGGGRSARA